MEVKTAVLADAANVSQEGKLNITGIFDRIQSADFPARWPAMTVVIRLAAHRTEVGQHDLRVDIADEDGRKIAQMGGSFHVGEPVRPGLPSHGQIIIPIHNAAFPKPGVYTFNILIDGRYEDSTHLIVDRSSNRKKK